MSRQSAWQVDANIPRLPALDRDLTVDVAVVGGGITGLTAAYLLHKAGKRVALLERGRLAGGDTAHTTAHLTFATDERISDLVETFGKDHARAAWDAGRAAMEQIHAITHTESIDCDFAWVPGHLHRPKDGGDDPRPDAELASELGFEAKAVESVPVAGTPGVRFARQAVFHPLKYLAGLAERLKAAGVAIHEGSEVTGISDDPLSLTANGKTVRCEYLVLATHVPLQGLVGTARATLFQTKLAPYTSYAVSARNTTGVPGGLWWDTADPYRYLRADRVGLILGGCDHKTGQEADPEKCFRELEAALAELEPGATVTERWSGQVIETPDGLPYIGEIADKQFIATGFGGNGMTFGTLSGMMACDAATGKKNPWAELFCPGRTVLKGAWDYLKEGADYPYYLVRDWLLAGEGTSLDVLKPGEGKLLRLNGERLACYRDAGGAVTTLSPTCTHMGCLVRWNPAGTTWDCPCHGSRFRPTGEVLAGPAETPLERVAAPGTPAEGVAGRPDGVYSQASRPAAPGVSPP